MRLPLLLEMNKGVGCYQYAGSHVVTMRQVRLKKKPAQKGGRQPNDQRNGAGSLIVSCLEAGPTSGPPIL